MNVSIERAHTVTVEFEDELVCTFGVRELRAACPCATCRGLRERGQQAWPRQGQSDSIEVADASLVGAWGLSITWSDGHDTGIYAWTVLRHWWESGFDMVTDPG